MLVSLIALRSLALSLAFGLAMGCEVPPDEAALVGSPDTVRVDSLGMPLADSLAVLDLVSEPDTLVVTGVRAATARLEAVGEGAVSGTVRLRQLEGGVRVRAEMNGLRETRLHGFQILRATSCEGADPDLHLGNDLGTPHGGPYRLAVDRHVGDLGNIRGGNGDGRYDRIDTVLRLNGTHSPVGRAVVVRAETDDATRPGGGAGEVLACGVFQPSR
ncbi:MAG: hypothetical protein Rubg2KO_06000 [Rubricoccaceae bacterium]